MMSRLNFAFLLNRLLWGIPVLLAVVVTSFVVLRFTPGGPFDREKPIPESILKNLRKQYKLDRPMTPVFTTPDGALEQEEMRQFVDAHTVVSIGSVHAVVNPAGIAETQLFSYIGQLLRGDLGVSMKYTQVTINQIIGRTLPVSLMLGLLAFVVAFLLGMALGVVAADHRGSWIDKSIMIISSVGFSVPNFVLAALLILVFSLKAKILPPALWEGPLYAILPVITLAIAPASYIARLTRSGMIDALHEDYIRTAHAKGLRPRAVLLKHALMNGLGPLITISGPLLAMLVTGSFIVELIFSLPGMGRYFVTAVIDRDYPMVMGVTVVYASFIVLANIAVDILYMWADPRVEV